MTLGIILMTLASIIAWAGFRYITQPTWHHCRWCGCFWTNDGAPDYGGDAPDVADECMCEKCRHAHDHALPRQQQPAFSRCQARGVR